MSGIDRELTPDPRSSLFDKHLPDTAQVQRLLRKEGKAYVFNDRSTMDLVTQAILERGEKQELKMKMITMNVMDYTFLLLWVL
jgi:hypothetical protein